MKVYNKGALTTGIFCACALPLFALDIIHADWWQWLITIALSARFLYIGLSKEGSERERMIGERYQETAAALFGKHHALKTNLPVFLAAGFFSVAGLLRFGLDVILPVGVWLLFIVLLAGTAAYSIGLNREIRERIEAEYPAEGSGGDE